MIRGILWGIVIVCCCAPSAAAQFVPPPAVRAGPSSIDDVVARLIEEASQARASLLLPEGEPDIAARLGRAVPAGDLLRALGTKTHPDPFIDAYVRWQLTSFDPDLPALTDDDFLRLMNNAPPLVENPRAAADVVELLDRVDDGGSLPPVDIDALRQMLTELDRREIIARNMSQPAEAWRDWVESKLPSAGPRPRQWHLERCAATVRAGWPPRTIKARLTREMKASRADPDFSPEQRRMVAGQIDGLAGLERRYAREVSIGADGTALVRFSTAAITRRDADRWIASLLGDPP